MYHIISHDTSHICVPPPVFEAHCKALAEKGCFGVGLREAEDFLIHGEPLPAKSFLFTFDDGYLDNYVHAWPILRKYGHKGVIFAVADKLDQAQRQGALAGAAKDDLSRPSAVDVASGACPPEALPEVDRLLGQDALGFTVRQDIFLNWDEARRMEKSGEIAVAGHSMRHASVFTGPGYSGFMRPGPRLRTFTRTWPDSFWGLPNFERGPELSNRAFIPSPDLVEAVKDLVPQDAAGAAEFFESPDKAAALARLVAGFKDALGDFESKEAMLERLGGVMENTQATLHRELGHGARSFCWPWGVFCEEALQLGQAAGFEAFYTTREGANRPGSPLHVHRFKVKNKPPAWLLARMGIYSRPLLASAYVKMRI